MWSYRLQSFGKPCGTVEDGGVWMKSGFWKINQNRTAIVKSLDMTKA